MNPVSLPRFLASTLLAAIAALPAFAATYYVSPSGLDTNAGTSSAAPWKTVAKINALTTLAPGDSVLFQRGGVWRETLTPPVNGTAAARITFDAYGSGALPVISGATSITSAWTATSGATAGTYQTALATSTSMVVANGSTYLKKGASATTLAANQYFWSTGVLYVNLGGAAPASGQVEAAQRNHALTGGGRDYITVKNLRLEKTNVSNVLLNSVSTGGWGPTLFFRLEGCDLFFGNSSSSFAGAGVHADGANDAVITRNHVNYALGDGVFVYRSLRVETSDNYIENVLDEGGNGGADGIQYSASSATPNACDGFIITGNTVIRPSTSVQKGCIQQEFGDNGLIADNICERGKFGIEANGNNVIVERNRISNVGTNGGIRVAQNRAYDGMKIRYNLVVSGASSGITITNDAGGTTARSNFEVHNNTVYNTFFGIGASQFSGSIKNNIIWNDGSSNPNTRLSVSTHAGGSLVSNHNIIHDRGTNPYVVFNGVSYSSLSAWQIASGQDLNSSSANPLFADITASNFHLQSGSPAINAGVSVGLSSDINGVAVSGAPDIGCYEYVADSFVTTQDEGDAGYVDSGNWTLVTGSGNGGDYKHDGNTGSTTAKWAKFAPSPALGGTYKIFLFWKAGADRATNATVRVYHANGNSTNANGAYTDYVVDMTQGDATNGSWRQVGITFQMDATDYVGILNNGANGLVICDAVKFSKQ